MHFNRRHKRTIRKSTAAFLAVTQSVIPAFAAMAGVWEVKDGNWMYKGEDGNYLANTWLRDPSDNRLYHLSENGVMDSGWKLIDGIWYFLTNEHNGFFGAALENTWAWVDGYCYYFGADGKMAAGCTTPDGFTVNSDGQWTENGTAVYIAGRGYQTKPAPTGGASASGTRTSGGGGGGSSSGGGSHTSGGGNSGNGGNGGGQSSGEQGDGNPGSDTAQTGDGSGSGDTPKDTVYSYTVRYTDTEGNLLASYERKALSDAIVTADVKEFAGYRKRDAGQDLFHLTMDQAVFVVVYEKIETGNQGGQEDKKEPEEQAPTPPNDEYTYIIRYKDKEGHVLAQSEGKGKPGEIIQIPECSFSGYEKESGQGDTRILGKDEEVFDIIYKKTEAAAQYSYTVRHIGPKGEILLEETGAGSPGDVVKLNAHVFDGCQLAGKQENEATLDLDGQVFNLYYASAEENTPIEGEDDACSYTVYYVGTDGEILHTVTGEGKAGDKLSIELMSFDGYREKKGQEHEKTLPEGNATFTVLYLAEKTDVLCAYTVRYAAMDGTLLFEEAGKIFSGQAVEIPVREFEGYREIENQEHTITPLSDGNIFYIKYEALREEEEPEEPKDPENPGKDPDGTEGGDTGDQDKGEKYSYSFIFVDGSGKQIGSKTGFALAGTVLGIPDIVLEGYKIGEEVQESYTVEKEGDTFSIQCVETDSLGDGGDPDTATPSTPQEQTYYYLLRYCDRDTGELIASESGLAYAGTEITPGEAPEGYTLADDKPFTVEATDSPRGNRFTVWCISDEYTLPEGSVEYTISCVDPDGNVIKTFTGTALSGTVIRPDYEIYGYDMDPESVYEFTLSEDNFTFEVLYIPYRIMKYEFRITDIDTGETLGTKEMEGRAGSRVDVPFTGEDFAIDGYDILSNIPENVLISSNESNNYMNIYARKIQEPVEVEDIRTYVVHFVSYHDRSVKIFDDRVGTAPAGADITVSFLTKVNMADGTYEAIAQGDTLTFTVEPQVDVNEFYVYYYRTEEFDNTEASEVDYSIQFTATDTKSVLAVMTGKAKPGERIYYRNTFKEYAFRTDEANFFIVTPDTKENYVTVPMYRVNGNPPAINNVTGKYDGAEWLMTFTDELGNQLLPWRHGYTRKGDTLYIDYPDVIYGEDGAVYRVMKEGPYVEPMEGTVYRQYNIKYKKGDESGNLLDKWKKEAQAAFDAIKRTVPYNYTVIYREEDSWNDVAVYAGVGGKGETISVQGISIPGYRLPDDTGHTFILDVDKKQVVFYCEPIDGNHSMQQQRNDYRIRFTDGKGNDVLDSVEGDMAFETGISHSYMTLHYPDTFRDKNGDIWEADEKGPKQLAMWNLDANQHEITYHRYYENGYDNLFADNAEDARRILTEAAVFTVDAEKHSYIVIGRDYDPSHTEVSSVISRYDIANYATEKLDEFVMDGVTYHITRITFNRVWHQESCTHDMEVTSRVEAGCEVTGMETRTCKKCGYSETTYFHAYGHEDANHDGMCDSCGAMMAMNIGDEITVTWNPGALGKAPISLNFICIDTDYKGTGKKLLYAIDALPPEYYGSYSTDGRADYVSSDLKAYLEDEFLDGLSSRDALTSVDGRSVGLLTMEEYRMYKAQAANVYKFPSGLTVLHEEAGADGLVALSSGKRVTPAEAGTKPVHPVLFMNAGGAVEGTVSGRWEVGDYQSRHIGDKSYLFRCVDDNCKDNSNLDKTMAVFLCDTVIPSYEGLGFNEDNTKRDTRFFGDSNNYRYSVIRQFLRENQRETGSMVTMDVGVKNEYEGSTAAGSFEALNEKDLTRHKRNVAQYLEEKLFIPSVEEALDMRDYLWKFDRSDRDNIDAVYDGNYLTGYWLRTPVYGTDDKVYVVNLKDGTIEPHSVKEEYGIPDTHTYMEYSADNGNTWSPCTEGSTTVTGPGSYLVRGKASGTTVMPALSGGMYVLQGTTSGQEYSTDGGATWNPCSDGQTVVGVSRACLVRVKGYSYQVNASVAVQVLASTDPSIEWSADGGITWNPCGQTLTQVPQAGSYTMRRKENPEGLWEQASLTRYRIDGTSYGYEYSKDNRTWQICTDGATYVTESGQYTIRRTETGEDREAVKKTCSIGIRPMYAVYQEQ